MIAQEKPIKSKGYGVNPGPFERDLHRACAQKVVNLCKDFRVDGSSSRKWVGRTNTEGLAQGLRGGVTKNRTLGFTLIELMIVIVVIAMVGTLTFVSVRKNQFQGTFRQYSDDVLSSFVRARNLAIDEQTQVIVTVTRSGTTTSWVDPVAQSTSLLPWDIDITQSRWAILSENDDDCIFGATAGVRIFEQAGAGPTQCSTSNDVLTFFPDGHLEMTGVNLNGNGVTIVVADQRTAAVTATHIHIFPGGLMRKIDNISG